MRKIYQLINSHKKPTVISSVVLLVILFILPFVTRNYVKINDEYTDVNSIAIYIKKYHELPINYITVYGNQTAATNNGDTTNMVIGGDTHWPDDNLDAFDITNDTMLKECDVYTNGYSLSVRGVSRLVYTCNTRNVRVFYTDDHYQTYQELTNFSLQLTSNIFWIIFGVYVAIGSVITIIYFLEDKNSKIKVIE